MKIAMLTHQYSIGGGEVVAFQLAEVMTKEGVELYYISGNPPMGEEEKGINVIRINQKEPHRFLHKYLVKFPGLYRNFGRNFFNKELDSILSEINPDIINVHGVAATHWDVSCIEFCLRHAPVVWTLHDMSSFTGRCGHAFDCNMYINGCTESCPDLHIPLLLPPRESKLAYQEKRSLIQSNNALSAIVPSKWLYDRAVEGSWRNKNVEIIPNGIPLDKYKQMDMPTSRGYFEISKNDTVIMAAASNLNYKHKGNDILCSALSMVNEPITLITAGHGSIDVKSDKVKVINLGFLDSIEMIHAFSAADLFVFPSLAETQGMVFVESIACGTPAIVFPVAALLEGMRPGVTGWLCDEISAESLANTINVAISDLKSGNTTFKCREVAEREYDINVQAKRYVSFFEKEVARCENLYS
ncbi:MAG: glycosyltransferase [Methanomicrobiales archaeon]|nr:glycosyltransferase [Methanomicrobiales archaeon]